MGENASSIINSNIYVLKNSPFYFLHTEKFVKEVGLSEGVFLNNVAIKGLLLPIFK